MEKNYIKENTQYIAKEESKKSQQRLKLIGGGYNGSKQEFRDTVLSFWSRYGQKPEKFWYDLYCSGKNAYDPRYVPDSMWYDVILPYYNYYILRKAYRDKAMYSRLFPDVKNRKQS